MTDHLNPPPPSQDESTAQAFTTLAVGDVRCEQVDNLQSRIPDKKFEIFHTKSVCHLLLDSLITKTLLDIRRALTRESNISHE